MNFFCFHFQDSMDIEELPAHDEMDTGNVSTTHQDNSDGPTSGAAALLPVDEAVDIDALNHELVAELSRISQLGKSCDDPKFYATCTQNLIYKLRKISNPSQAANIMCGLSSRARNKIGFRIGVNDSSRRRPGVTRGAKRIAAGRPAQRPLAVAREANDPSPSRRNPGITRGCKKTPAGRPPQSQPLDKRSRKRPHKLALSVSQNKSHPKAHGH